MAPETIGFWWVIASDAADAGCRSRAVWFALSGSQWAGSAGDASWGETLLTLVEGSSGVGRQGLRSRRRCWTSPAWCKTCQGLLRLPGPPRGDVQCRTLPVTQMVRGQGCR